jgi:hypothetical protein
MVHRVASNPPSFGGAEWPISGSPLRSVLRYRRRFVSRLPRFANLPAPSGGLPEFPRVVAPSGFCLQSNLRVAPNLLPLAHRRANFQVTLNLRSFGVADGSICESPRFSFLRLCRRWLPGLPQIRIYDWVDDESPAVLELCILCLRSG